ncbi:MAG: [Fe-S]-binding protein [Chlamydia sp. 32-24]|nr:MAG: [Fe-S]-binding protein [Chlamydia sp. 32-24]
MSLESLLNTFTWTRFSKKIMQRIMQPRNVGFFTEEQAYDRGIRLVAIKEGSIKDGNELALYWLVDKEDGVIIDAKFKATGQSILIGASDIACDLIVGKNYDQARRMSTDLIEKEAQDKHDKESFPKETYPHLNLILSAIEKAAEQCMDIPFAINYETPVPNDLSVIDGEGYPGWKDLPLRKKLEVIEEVLDKDIRPYIALDNGGVTVLNLIQDKELVIAYQGSCTSCYSSIGTTLSYIQQVIRAKVDPNLTVVPNLDGLDL